MLETSIIMRMFNYAGLTVTDQVLSPPTECPEAGSTERLTSFSTPGRPETVCWKKVSQ